MDIVIKRDLLLKPLQDVSGVVEKKQTQPILSHVLLSAEATDHKLCLTGTNIEVEIVGYAPIEQLTTPGTTTVGARTLLDICRALPEDTLLHLKLEKNYLIVKAGSSCYTLNTLSPLDFPKQELGDFTAQINIKQSTLKNLLTKTYFAMGQQDVRHYLNGVFLDINQNTMKCVAADGHRLALAVIEDEGIDAIALRMIVPRKSVLELIRLLNDNEQSITLNINESRLQVATTEFTFTSKLINAQYPDYNRLIPRGTTTLVGEREAIKQALARASILLNEKFRGVCFQLGMDKLRITANNSDQEQAEEAISLDYKGDNMEIGFNAAYLLDVFSALTTKIVRCVFTDPNSGVLIEAVGEDQSLYVIMPMRL